MHDFWPKNIFQISFYVFLFCLEKESAVKNPFLCIFPCLKYDSIGKRSFFNFPVSNIRLLFSNYYNNCCCFQFFGQQGYTFMEFLTNSGEYCLAQHWTFNREQIFCRLLPIKSYQLVLTAYLKDPYRHSIDLSKFRIPGKETCWVSSAYLWLYRFRKHTYRRQVLLLPNCKYPMG